MANFLDTHGIAHALNQVITKAEKYIQLISPYISFPTILFERLQDADERGVEITIVYGKTPLKHREIEQLAQLDNLSLYYLDNLHAKCYSNEKIIVISSMNLYDYSEKNNREMGIQFDVKGEFSYVSRDALRECESIIKASETIIARKPKYKSNKDYYPISKTLEGHCIRCDIPIFFDPTTPYCKKCYWDWVTYRNPNYREKHCHACGKKIATTMNYPLCMQC